jgi:hypothetical protein
MKEWRQQHPHATLREIEQAMDERLNKLRAEMLEEWAHLASANRLEPGCPRGPSPL